MADLRCGERLGNDFQGIKKMFWRGKASDEMVKDVNGQILRNGVELRRRWAEYFEQVLNVEDAMEANMNAAIGGCQCWESCMREQYRYRK